MAVKRRIPLNQITGVAAGSTATIKLPTNVRYHEIHLEYDTDTTGGPTEANMETEITEIRVLIDNVVQRRFSALQLFDINRTKGKTPNGGTGKGYLPIFFSEPQRLTHAHRELTAWGMQGVGDFSIEVDIANNSAQAAELKGFAVVDDVQEPPKGIVKWKREIIQVAATGDLVYRLDTERGDSYQGLHFFEGTAGDIGKMLITWDGVKVWEITEDQDDSIYTASDYTEVAKLYFVPLDGNNPLDALPAVKRSNNGTPVKVQELLATLTMDQAANVTLIREVVGTPD